MVPSQQVGLMGQARAHLDHLGQQPVLGLVGRSMAIEGDAQSIERGFDALGPPAGVLARDLGQRPFEVGAGVPHPRPVAAHRRPVGRPVGVVPHGQSVFGRRGATRRPHLTAAIEQSWGVGAYQLGVRRCPRARAAVAVLGLASWAAASLVAPATTATAAPPGPSTSTGNSGPATTPPSVPPSVPTSGSAPGPTSSTSTAPAAPPVDMAAITTDQMNLVKREHQAAIDADQRAVSSAQTTLGRDQQALAGDQQQATNSTAAVTHSTQTLQSDEAAQRLAVSANQRANAAVDADRQQLRTIAVQIYEGPPTPATQNLPTAGAGSGISGAPSLGLSDQLQQAQENDAGQVYFGDAVGAIDHTAQLDAARQAQTAKQVQQLTTAVSRDTTDLSNANQQASSAAQSLQTQRDVVARDTQTAATAGQQLTTDQNSLTAALAALSGPPLARPRPAGDASPSILGPAALTAAELVSWFNAQGYADSTSTPILQLAQWYLSEGQAEGVRGDIAFAQAVLETGGFASPDAVAANNYAGIGHCDLCPSGLPFPSPLLGVRGQIQLLRAYADPSLSTAQLASPPAVAQVAPEGQSVRGCCGTWQSLTGVWASSPIYGNSILSLYLSMLAAALGTGAPPGAPSTSVTAPPAPPALAPPAP